MARLSWLATLATQVGVIVRIVLRILLGGAGEIGGPLLLSSGAVVSVTRLGNGGAGDFVEVLKSWMEADIEAASSAGDGGGRSGRNGGTDCG